jgi:hypothetical protein
VLATGTVSGRVTFDERGNLTGSGGNVPSHWKGPIQVVIERQLSSGAQQVETVSMPAETYLQRLTSRANLAEFELG